ncbi:MAG: flagellar basal body rod protein FlgB [bacterium]
MIKTSIFEAAHLGELKQALQVYAKRHRVTADNIANIETRGYRAQEYRFEEYLQGAGGKLRGVSTRANHLAIGRRGLADTQGRIEEQDNNFDNGVNNVNIDKEMADLVTNDLTYRLVTRLLSKKYDGIRLAIKGS